MNKPVSQENIARFSGYTDVYNAARPVPPEVIKQSILLYASTPQVVVDIGSGTGLSTQIWQGVAPQIIGIEPNDDMRNAAQPSEGIEYRAGYSNETGLPDACADIVTISQAFHWMDIDSTLEEVHRILKPGGMFAVYDCDWPPAVHWQVELGYKALQSKCDALNFAQEKHATRNDKGSYIARFNAFGKFKFVKEVVCHSVEPCTPERMIGIALSQGAIQDALKLGAPVQPDIDDFCKLVRAHCPAQFEIMFSYRLRLGMK
ncbi:MAG: class I SAM-dependent methyltransferase [Oscillospiraceae bacterium]|nr:class I SAM-dependent methyltransferase [Oscillospiraceae bacterium]